MTYICIDYITKGQESGCWPCKTEI